jgi:hypothetical protein
MFTLQLSKMFVVLDASAAASSNVLKLSGAHRCHFQDDNLMQISHSIGVFLIDW